MAEPGEDGVSELNPLAEVRQARMAGIIWDEGFARVTDLAGRFGVSAVTVQADLTALEARARVRRVRGGAVPPSGLLGERPYRQAVMIAQEVGDRHREGQALHGVGVALTELGELDEAEKRLREALLIRREVSDQPGESRTRFRLANVQRDQGRHAEAQADYEASLATLRAIGDRYHEGLVLWQMGVAAQQQGAGVMAQTRWQQAMTILEAMGCSETDQVRRLIAGGSADSDPPAAVRAERCV